MKLTILASGSKANAAVLETDHGRILVDCGLSASQIVTRMTLAKLDPKSITAIVLTHEHADHTAGLERFVKSYPVPIYANGMTLQAVINKCPSIPNELYRHFRSNSPFYMDHSGSFLVDTFSVQHDAADPVGFVFDDGSGSTLGFATDLGEVTDEMMSRLYDASTVFIESNYDEQLIVEDKTRPWRIKERIMSRNGHLSNQQAAEAISGLSGAKAVILGHLSAHTNSPEAAISAVRELAGDTDLTIHCAFTPERERCKPPITIDLK